MNRVLLLLSIVLLSACNDAATQNAEDVKKPPVPPKAETFDLSMLLGEWMMQGEDGTIMESWAMDGHNLVGRGYVIHNGKEEENESLRIRAAEQPVYTAIVQGQPPVDFVCTEQDSKHIVFMNKAHDFPQVIRYDLIGTDSIVATVGLFPLETAANKFSLFFKKVK